MNDNILTTKLEGMNDAQLITYSEAYLGMDGRELIKALTLRLKKVKSENYGLVREIESRDSDI